MAPKPEGTFGGISPETLKSLAVFESSRSTCDSNHSSAGLSLPRGFYSLLESIQLVLMADLDDLEV